MCLWTRKNGLNLGIYPFLDHEDTKTEKLQHHNSVDLTTTSPLFTVDQKQTDAVNKLVNHNVALVDVCAV